MRPEFHWNVKQIYVWVSAEWDSKKGHSEVTIWDQIIQSQPDALMNVTGALAEYPLPAQLVGDFAHVRLNLKYNTFPHSGLLAWFQGLVQRASAPSA